MKEPRIMPAKKPTSKGAARLAAQRRAIEELAGIGWEGDLEEMRESRFTDLAVPEEG